MIPDVAIVGLATAALAACLLLADRRAARRAVERAEFQLIADRERVGAALARTPQPRAPQRHLHVVEDAG